MGVTVMATEGICDAVSIHSFFPHDGPKEPPFSVGFHWRQTVLSIDLNMSSSLTKFIQSHPGVGMQLQTRIFHGIEKKKILGRQESHCTLRHICLALKKEKEKLPL